MEEKMKTNKIMMPILAASLATVLGCAPAIHNQSVQTVEDKVKTLITAVERDAENVRKHELDGTIYLLNKKSYPLDNVNDAAAILAGKGYKATISDGTQTWNLRIEYTDER